LSVPVEIVERKTVPSGWRILCGLPDVGLVGAIAVSHIASQLKLNEVAYISSDLLPPIVVLEKGLPRSPLRILGNDGLMVLISEIAIPAGALQPIMRAIVDWMEEKKVEAAVSLGGLPIPNRQEIKEPKVFGVASEESFLKTLNYHGIEIIEHGFLVGPQALILKYCAEKKIPAIALLAESFYNYPDPEAAAAVIGTLNRIIKAQIDVSKLLEKGEEVRLRMRDMMRRTQPELARMKKSREYDIPGYYVT